jgi:ornithine cyclodeaminase
MYMTILRRTLALALAPSSSCSRSTMLVLSETDVRHCLDMRSCLEANRRALIAVASGQAIVPERIGLPYKAPRAAANHPPATGACGDPAGGAAVPAAQDWTLYKPAAMEDTDKNSNATLCMGMKVVSIRDRNPALGLPLVPATVLYQNPATGIVEAVVAATYLTAARTAAASALAVQHHYSTPSSATGAAALSTKVQHLVVFGAGLQAEQHVHAIATAMHMTSFPRITIVNRTYPRAQALKETLVSQGLVGSGDGGGDCFCTVVLLDDSTKISEALASADVVVTTTNTDRPLWDGAATQRLLLKDTCIITGIGSYTPYMHEVPTDTVQGCSTIYIDTLGAKTVGDLKHVQEQDPRYRLLGDVISDRELKPLDAGTDTAPSSGLAFYKGVGTAIQDILTAEIIVKNARRLNIGTEVDMS